MMSECIGDEGKRNRQHCAPYDTDKHEAHKEQPLVMDEEYGCKTDCPEEQAHPICLFKGFELGNDECPEHCSDGLNGKEYAHPVASSLIFGRLDIGSTPAAVRNGAVGVGPKVKERRPAEELHKADRPECLGCLEQKLHKTGVLFFDIFLDAMELGIFLRIEFLDFKECKEHAEDKYRGTAIEAPFDRIWDNSLGGCIGNANPREENREKITNKTSGIAEETLSAVRLCFLLLAHHITHHHLEWLHSDIDRSVEEYETEESEPHRGIKPEEYICLAQIQASGIGKQKHHKHRDNGADKKIGLAPAEAAPCTVGPFADEGLYYHTHQRRKYPEEAQLVRVCSEGCEYTGNVGALKRIGNLDSKESKVEIKYLAE